jgi:uracil-DNA glycosylase
VFNPARANPDAMRLHMPKKYWRNMPETAAIPNLLRSAASRVDSMIRDGSGTS